MNPDTLTFIKSFEGCVLHPYLDVSKTPTIGVGMTYYPSTGMKVTMQDPPLTQAQADSEFALMVKPYLDGVIEACHPIILNTNQQTSLTDFAYNLGLGAFKQSTLLQHVLKGDVQEVDFTLYDHVKGQVSVDLLNRRKAEYELFIKPITIMEPTTSAPMEPANVDVTKETKQVIQVKKVTVDWTNSVDGGVEANGQSELPITPEIIAAVQAIQDPTYNIEVTA